MEDLSLEDLDTIIEAIRMHPPGGSPFDGVTYGQLLALALHGKETLESREAEPDIDSTGESASSF